MKTLCRSCRAEIVWLKTTGGKAMPVDAASVQEGDKLYSYTRHISHFASCPDAKKFRRAKPAGAEHENNRREHAP